MDLAVIWSNILRHNVPTIPESDSLPLPLQNLPIARTPSFAASRISYAPFTASCWTIHGRKRPQLHVTFKRDFF